MTVAWPKLKMRYRSIADLNTDVIAWLPSLPRDLGLIVGIPRSGLLAANLIALHLNLPLADLDGFIAGRKLSGGERLSQRSPSAWSGGRRTLIVDDSYATGKAMNEVRRRVREANLGAEVYFAAVYINPGSGAHLDFYAREVGQPRAFEWNIMHHQNLITNCCMDIDGVLCRDPSEAENDDGPNYLKFITEVTPKYVPTYTVANLVTSRLEKYRPQTEAWLARHNVPYRRLSMLDMSSAVERARSGCHASFKASVYKSTESVIFYESSINQAPEIAQRSGKFVFCTDTREMILPSASARSRWIASEFSHRVARKIKNLLKYPLSLGSNA